MQSLLKVKKSGIFNSWYNVVLIITIPMLIKFWDGNSLINVYEYNFYA